jgi:2-polyprenyl-6-methoxyphenol hydroxylase-like FAD-dependent oxidoreductase
MTSLSPRRRLERNPQPHPGRGGEALKRARRGLHPAAFEARDYRLRRVHPLGQPDRSQIAVYGHAKLCLMSNRSVLISGIGIAGSTLAFWLGEHGYHPTLIERAPRLRTGGYVIDFWGRGFDIAERMGLLPDLKSEGYDIKELRLVDSHGKRVGGFRVDVFRKLTEGRYVSLSRGDLAKLIYRKIDGRFESIFGDSVVNIEQNNDGVEVAFEHARPRTFDLVIGADGLHSAVRKLVFGNEDRFEKYLGYTVAAFEVGGYRPRDELVYVSHSVPGKQVARFAMRDDRTLFLLIFATD